MLIGLGKQVKKLAQQELYTVSFSVYDSNLPATQTGDAPVISDKMAGETFTIPDQGNLVRTETSYQVPPGGGDVQQVPTNITLYAWSDGNAIYFPGDTYTMPNSNITLYAIWNTLYSPSITSISPNPSGIGTEVDIYGYALATTNSVKFNRNKFATFTVISDTHIKAIVPSGATNGTVAIGTNNGGLDTISGFMIG